MIRRLFRRVFKLALVIGGAAALYKVVQARKPSPGLPDGGGSWKPVPGMGPSEAKPAAAPAATGPPATAEVETAAPARAAPATKATPPATKAKRVTATNATSAWVEPEGSTCPTTHPVKGKIASLIYHLPGMLAYERTKPDRCYRDGKAAEADGLRKAKR